MLLVMVNSLWPDTPASVKRPLALRISYRKACRQPHPGWFRDALWQKSAGCVSPPTSGLPGFATVYSSLICRHFI